MPLSSVQNKEILGFPVTGESGAGQSELGTSGRPRNQKGVMPSATYERRPFASTVDSVVTGGGSHPVDQHANYGDEPRREEWCRQDASGHNVSAEMPTSPTHSEMETRLDYAVGGFFFGCCVMVGAYILGTLFWKAM